MDKQLLKSSISLCSLYPALTGSSLTESSERYIGLCPFHDDHNIGNFFIYPKTNTYHCFSCGAGGDIFNFVQELKKISFLEACKLLESMICFGDVSSNNIISSETIRSRKLSLKSKEIYRFFFDRLSLTETGLKYLRWRGFNNKTISEFQLKSLDDADSIYQALKEQFSLDDILDSGLAGINKTTGNDYPVFYNPCIVIPVMNDGEPIYFIIRNIGGKGKKRFFKLINVPQVYLAGDISCNEIIVVEGAFDAMSYYQLTGKSNFIVMNGLNTRAYRMICQNFPDKKIVLAFDCDNAGRKAADKLCLELSETILQYDYSKLLSDNQINYKCKDMNEILQLVEWKASNPAMIEKFKFQTEKQSTKMMQVINKVKTLTNGVQND